MSLKNDHQCLYAQTLISTTLSAALSLSIFPPPNTSFGDSLSLQCIKSLKSVKSGESLSVSPEEGRLIHVSQVALGEVKNIEGVQYVPIRMKIDDKKYIIGSLSAESRPHLTFDLVFEKEFELSHDWKDGSVYFCGYTADNPDQEEFGPDFSDEDEDEEEDLILENGKVVPDVQVANPTKSKDAAKKPVSATKPKVTLVDPKKEKSDKEEDSDDSDEELNDDSDDSDLSGDSDDDMSEHEETPKKAEPSKKRPSESATKTPVGTAKKAKSDTPQKTDGKKGSGHKATPHPSKQAVKKTVETPKSSGQVSCKSCSKTFNSEKGLESHSKAKHGGK